MSVRSLQPTAVTVVGQDGETLLELIVNPRKTVRHLKTQIAGFQETAVGNQQLLLDGRPLDDSASLSSLGIEGAVTLVLVCLPPVLSGRLTLTDLRLLSSDDDSLELAIDAYSDEPRYSLIEIEVILAAVSSSLLPAPSLEDATVQGSTGAALAKEVVRTLSAFTPSLESSARASPAQRNSFKQALKAGLQGVMAALENVTRGDIEVTPAPAPAAEVSSPGCMIGEDLVPATEDVIDSDVAHRRSMAATHGVTSEAVDFPAATGPKSVVTTRAPGLPLPTGAIRLSPVLTAEATEKIPAHLKGAGSELQLLLNRRLQAIEPFWGSGH